MITRSHRFHGYNAFRHVYNRGQTVRGSLTSVKYINNPRRTGYRAAVVVSRKVHKSAVVRNRIRRRVYEIIRDHESQINVPYDVVVTVFSEQIAEMESASLEKLIAGQLKKAGILAAGLPSSRAAHAIVDPKERP